MLRVSLAAFACTLPCTGAHTCSRQANSSRGRLPAPGVTPMATRRPVCFRALSPDQCWFGCASSSCRDQLMVTKALFLRSVVTVADDLLAGFNESGAADGSRASDQPSLPFLSDADRDRAADKCYFTVYSWLHKHAYGAWSFLSRIETATRSAEAGGCGISGAWFASVGALPGQRQ